MHYKHYTDARVAELQAAFNRVAPKDNWKTAIDVTLPMLSMADMLLIKEAITFYTGSVATMTDIGDQTRVQAPGYYAAVGA